MKAMLFLLLGLCRTLHAYAPSADFILAEMAKHCVSGKVQFNGVVNGGKNPEVQNLVLRSDGLFVTKRSPVLSSSAVPQIVEEKVNLFVLQHLVSCQEQGVRKIKEYLTAQGVDIKKVSHRLHNYVTVFIIGAEPGDTKAPQIWIEKQNFVPLVEKSENRTVSFENWIPIRALADKKWPSIITTTINGKESKLAISASTQMPLRK